MIAALRSRLRDGAGPVRGSRPVHAARTGSTGRPAARGRLARLRADRERGASAVEYAILVPIFLVLTFLIIQSGMYYYARNIAQSAAEDAARSARATPGQPPDVNQPQNQPFPGDDLLQQRAEIGFQATLTALDPNGGFFQNRTVEAHGNEDSGLVNVDVRGSSVNLLPHFFPTMNIHTRAGGSVEIFKQPGAN